MKEILQFLQIYLIALIGALVGITTAHIIIYLI